MAPQPETELFPGLTIKLVTADDAPPSYAQLSFEPVHQPGTWVATTPNTAPLASKSPVAVVRDVIGPMVAAYQEALTTELYRRLHELATAAPCPPECTRSYLWDPTGAVYLHYGFDCPRRPADQEKALAWARVLAGRDLGLTQRLIDGQAAEEGENCQRLQEPGPSGHEVSVVIRPDHGVWRVAVHLSGHGDVWPPTLRTEPITDPELRRRIAEADQADIPF
jgi:hypothetical protein